jgi:hypothetical protein
MLYNLENHSVIVRENIVTIDVAPFLPVGGAVKMTGLPVVNPATPIPVFMAHMFSLFPVIVPHILIMMFLVVMVILCDSRSTQQAQADSAHS